MNPFLCKVPGRIAYRNLVGAVLGTLFGLMGWASQFLSAQGVSTPNSSPERAASQVSSAKLPVLYFGTKACASAGCHEKGQTADPPLLCRCDELDRWRADDKHADAFTALSTELGKRMLKTLYPNIQSPAQARECVACHGAVVEKQDKQHPSFDLNEGVSCVVCHGAHEEWVGKHSLVISRDEFRKLDRATKESQFGMTDLWDPAKRARLCASCHIGNPEQGKFVTHDMYAAGHPPLPGFELTHYTEQMPRHWQNRREKPPAIQKLQGFTPELWEQTQLLLVGAAITQAESMKLLKAQAAQARAKGQWLDWANFDCYACHHDLKLPSWRQNQGYAGRPGRIPMKHWPNALVYLATQALPTDESTSARQKGDSLMKQLSLAFVDRPFGNLQAIETQASELAAWSETLAQKVQSQPTGEMLARRLWKKGPQLMEWASHDFESARQAAWALQMLRAEEKEILGLVRPEWDPLESELNQILALRLPRGRSTNTANQQKEVLKTLYNFDPAKLRDWIARARISMN